MGSWDTEREKIIGLGDQSVRKSYYPVLKFRLQELERFRSILDRGLDAILLVKLPDGVIMDCNKTACIIFEKKHEDLVGVRFVDLFSSEDYKPIEEFLDDPRESSLSGHRFHLQFEEKWVTYELNLSKDRSGKDFILVGVFRDITKRVETEIKLLAAKEEAEKASSVKSEFLAVMSHEMRTPLNPILGFSQILREIHEEGEEAEYLDLIIDAANQQLELIDNLLSYTSMDKGMLSSQDSDFELNALCEKSIKSIETISHGLKLYYEFGTAFEKIPTNLMVRGDAGMISRILDNLLVNACKYTKEGSVTLKVDIKKINDQQSTFYFSVIDTGIGIEQDIQSSLFEPFTQADSSSRRTYQGVGLGLAISKKLVEFLGGTLSVTSDVGEGSIFHFSIPLTVVSETYQTINDTTHSNELSMLSKPLNILVVEDMKSNQRVIQKACERIGASVELADNGFHALEKCKSTYYDVILMDLTMPAMDGLETTSRIRSPENLNHSTTIIALTADVSPGIRQQCELAGIDDYMQKPLNLHRFYHLLENVIR